MTAEAALAHFRDLIVSNFPDLAASRFSLSTAGWESHAIDVDDQLIFKFPRQSGAREALVREAAVLAEIRPAVAMPVPDMRIVNGPPLFSVHRKLPGEHLLPEQYAVLGEDARQALGVDLGRFYGELHKLDPQRMEKAGAQAVEPWLLVSSISTKALPLLDREHRTWAERTLERFQNLAPDPFGTTFGYFDGHGWNMAFDPVLQRLNGLFDFADSGFGPLHQEFVYSGLVSADLTLRTVAAYEAATGRSLDRNRILVLTSMHRLSELAELADQPEYCGAMLEAAMRWIGELDCMGSFDL